MEHNIFYGLINNAALLLALGVLYDILLSGLQRKKTIRDSLIGLIIGGIGIAVLINTFRLAPGANFDTRSILLSVSAIFFGTLSTIIATACVAVYRGFQGGVGAFTGILVACVSSLLGLALRYYRKKHYFELRWYHLYVFGIVVHIAMLLCMLTFPANMAKDILNTISIPVITIYPVVTVLLGILLQYQYMRNQTQSTIAQSKNFLTTLLETIPNPIYYKDTSGVYKGCNQAYVDFLGKPKDAIIGKTVFDINPAEKATIFYEMDRKLYNYPGTQRYESIVESKDSIERNILFSKATYTDENSNIAGILGVMTDITELKKTEQALTESEHRYREIFENATESIFLFEVTDDKRFKFIDINPMAEKMISNHAHQVQGKYHDDVLPLDLAEIMKINYLSCVDSGKVVSYEEQVELTSGFRYFYTTLIPLKNHFGIVERLVAMSSDITMRKQAEFTILDNEKKFKSYIDNAPDGIFITDEHGNYIEVNKAASTITGYSEQELLTMNLIDFTPEKEKNNALNHFSELTEKGKSNGELQFIHKSGEVRYWSVDAVRLAWNRFLGFVRDISERKTTEEVILKQAETVSVLNEIISMANKAENLEELYSCVLSSILKIFNYDLGGIYLVDETNQTASLVFSLNVSNSFRDAVSKIDCTAEPYNRLFLQQQPVVIDNYKTKYPEFASVSSIHSLVSIPLISKMRTIGALNIGSKKNDTVDTNELAIIVLISRELGVMIEKMLIEEEARSLSANLEGLFNSLDDMVFVFDANGIINDVNKTVLRKTAYSFNELRGNSLTLLYSADQTDILIKSIQEVADGIRNIWTYPIFTKGGKILDIETSLTKCLWYGSEAIISVSRDISERKIAEAEIKKVSERLLLATDAAEIGIWDLDIVNNILIWDDMMFTLYGLEKQAVLNVYDVCKKSIHPEDSASFEALMARVLKLECDYDTDFRIIRPDGSIRYIKANAMLSTDTDGKPIRILGTNYDITDRKNAENALITLNKELEKRVTDRTAQLEASNKELEAFAYSVSHDLRAPLRIIDGYSQILAEDHEAALSEDGKKLLHVIRNYSQKMDKLISDILSLSRLARADLSCIEVNMREIIESVWTETIPEAVRSLFTLTIREIPRIYADPVLLRQVWVNLIGNAVKYSENSKNKKIDIGSKKTENGIEFYIQDHGVGFNDAYKEKLFGVFQRLHREDEYEGTGIGLATIKRIIGRHGGQVSAESNGDGATFKFTLPLRGEHENM